LRFHRKTGTAIRCGIEVEGWGTNGEIKTIIEMDGSA
jgi:hypothetical protein